VVRLVKIIYMKIEVIKDNKKLKVKKTKKRELNIPEIDFNSINQLKGNKILLEYFFQSAKLELLN
jgi:hypothetical protein